MRAIHVFGLSTLLVFLGAGVALAGEPTDQVRRSVDEVIKVAQGSADGPARREEVRRIATRLFDFEETAKRALGSHWHVGKIDSYQGEKVTYVAETVEGDHATVKTRVVTKQGTEVPVDYRLLNEKEGWRVYDVVIEGVSLVGNYRTQFNKIIQTSSFEDLVKRMRAKDFSAPEGSRGRRS